MIIIKLQAEPDLWVILGFYLLQYDGSTSVSASLVCCNTTMFLTKDIILSFTFGKGKIRFTENLDLYSIPCKLVVMNCLKVGFKVYLKSHYYSRNSVCALQLPCSHTIVFVGLFKQYLKKSIKYNINSSLPTSN